MKLILANPKKRILIVAFAILSASSYGFLLSENQKIEKEDNQLGFKEVLLENETVVPTAFLIKKVLSECSKLYR